MEAFLASSTALKLQPVLASEVPGLAEAITDTGYLRTFPFHLSERGGLDCFFATRLIRQ